jgi:fructose-1,6-bisphosphatase II
MDKLVGGPEVADALDITAPPRENVERAARAKGVKPSEIAVVVLDRERNQPVVEGLREAGAKVNLITDGDVAPAIAAARPGTGVDLMMGIGGTPEGVIAAAAVKCLGGSVQGRLWPRDDGERQKLLDDGYDVERVLTTDDLCGGDNVFVAATGVTDGALLRGVRYTRDGAVTDSIVMRSRSGTVRRVEAQHAFEKLERFSGREYR